MVQLYTVDSPINREQRNNINETFADIQRNLSNLRYQISILVGGADLEEIINRIEQTITNANNTTSNTQEVLDNISAALNQLQTALNDSQSSTQDARNAINEINAVIASFNFRGEYNTNETYYKNNIVRYGKNSHVSLVEQSGVVPTDDGINWRIVALGGVDGSGSVSTVNGIGPNDSGNVILDLLNIGVNVKDYGALGDGLADDTQAIQNAINYAQLNEGNLYFPDGNYRFTSNISISTGMKNIFSTGKVKLIHSGKDYVGISINNTEDLLIQGISFEGDDITNPATLSYIESNERIKFYNCNFGTMGGTALSFALCTGVSVDQCYFTDTGHTAINGDGITAHPSKPAIWVGEAPQYTNNNINITRCKFYNINWSGIYYFAKSGVVDGNDFSGCRESTIFADTAENVKIINNKIFCGSAVNIANFGIEYGGGRFFTIANNLIQNAGESAIAIAGARYFTIANNQCINNGISTTAAEQQRCGILLREYSTDSASSRGIIKGNICQDTKPTGSKLQLYGLLIYRNSDAATLTSIIIEGNYFAENAVSSVRIWDEQTLLYDTIRFRNNLGYADKPKTLTFTKDTTPGVTQFLGFGFKASFIELFAYVQGTDQWCKLTYDTTGAGVINGSYHYGTSTFPTNYLRIFDNVGNEETSATWNSTSLLNDGFQLNFLNARLPINLIVTCYP